MVSLLSYIDLLEARARNLEAERRRERIPGVRRWRRRKTVEPPPDRRAAAPSAQA